MSTDYLQRDIEFKGEYLDAREVLPGIYDVSGIQDIGDPTGLRVFLEALNLKMVLTRNSDANEMLKNEFDWVSLGVNPNSDREIFFTTIGFKISRGKKKPKSLSEAARGIVGKEVEYEGVTGVIQVEDNSLFFCSDNVNYNGNSCNDKLGKLYSCEFSIHDIKNLYGVDIEVPESNSSCCGLSYNKKLYTFHTKALITPKHYYVKN